MTLNILAILLAAVSSMAVGGLWFSPRLFGPLKAAQPGGARPTPGRPAVIFPLAFIAGLIVATVLAGSASLIHQAVGGSALLVTLAVASALWLGFSAAATAVHYLFEGRTLTLFAINASHQLVTSLVMALIIGLFGF